jgi:hypothetical protein
MDALPLEIRITLFATLALSVAAGVCVPPPRRPVPPAAIIMLSVVAAGTFAAATYALLADRRAFAAIAVATFVHSTVALMWATRRREDGEGPGPDDDTGGWDDGPDPAPDGGGGVLPADWWDTFSREFWAHVDARERVGAGSGAP